VLLVIAGLMAFPVLCGLCYGETREIIYFLQTILICLVIGYPLSRFRVIHSMYFARDGLIAVGLGWVVISIFGALPFYFSGAIPSFVDSFFETVSGFTTTGSSILREIESLPKCMLFWRSFTHWIGGMGILVFVLAIIPKASERSMHILRAESPGPVIGKLVPRIRKSSYILYSIYMVLTVTEIVLLLLGGMPLFDALCHSFGTAGTGGFSVLNTGIGQYNNPYFEMVIAVFMALFGINFNFYFFVMIKEWKAAWKMEEVRSYLAIIAGCVLLIALNILPVVNSDFIQAFRYSFFQVSSIITTTGYATANFDLWPTFSKMILLILMVFGACAGSTGGGIKISRVMIILKKVRMDLQRMIHPSKVQLITFDGKEVPKSVVDQIMSYFGCFMLILGITLLIVSLDGFDFESTVSACFACIGNIGPGFGICGPLGNFADFSVLSKLTLSAAMLIGRLEIYPVLIFLAPFLGRGKIHKRPLEEALSIEDRDN
ncbi:MAG: TrkH family potassium uptake protein, partial [Erysipelotrichaceae bacterium]|nr:TrkH family potassium uptake protein [Erysipelotrichaceae bacterium]